MEKRDIFVEDGDVITRMRAPHPQVLGYFPHYSLDSMVPGTIVDYSNPLNITGHQQRAWICYMAMRSYLDTGIIGLEVASGGVATPYCLSTDFIGNNERPVYGGVMLGVHIKIDMNDLSIFGVESFGCVIGNHALEHANCDKLKGGESQEEKLAIDCDAMELVDLLDNHWLRVVKPGGFLIQVVPDETPCRRHGSSSLFHDQTHNHMLDPEKLRNIFWHLKTPTEIVEFDTFKNQFSVNFALRKY